MSPAVASGAPGPRNFPKHAVPARFSVRVFAVLALTLGADFLFFRHPAGWTLGLFALLANAAILFTHQSLMKRTAARLVLAANIIVAGALIYSPSPLAILLGLVGALAFASLAQMGPLPHVFRWTWRLGFMLVSSVVTPLAHFIRYNRIARRLGNKVLLRPVLRLAIMPVIFGILFTLMFSYANPVIDSWLGKIDWAAFFNLFDVVRWIFWGTIAAIATVLMKPRLPKWLMTATAARPDTWTPDGNASHLFTVSSVIVSLLMFNLMFAVQNGLDIKFLYAGPGFVNGASQADYVHRGAWALIATALMAAAFVLIALRRGSPLAENTSVRILLGAWIAQNVLLVGSSILRTLNYIEMYDLTYLRIFGLIWMGLVAVGLILICLRVLNNRSNAWLVNANALATIAVLLVCCWVNFTGIIADYNVRHARELDGNGQQLDVAYLQNLGPNSLPALSWYAQQVTRSKKSPAAVSSALYAVGAATALNNELNTRQENWRAWTLESARLQHRLPALDAVKMSLGETASALGVKRQSPILTEEASDVLLEEMAAQSAREEESHDQPRPRR